jgi:hypothetical protein
MGFILAVLVSLHRHTGGYKFHWRKKDEDVCFSLATGLIPRTLIQGI